MNIQRKPSVEPFHAMDVLAEATRLRAAGHEVISMAVGQPAHPAPGQALEAARTALKKGRVGYTDALGSASLRRAISGHYHRMEGLEVDPGRIAVTTGSSAGFNLAFVQLFSPGDHVAISRPGYPAYRNILTALGLIPVEIHVGADTGHVLAPEALDAWERNSGKKIAGVLVASPANPTGAVTPRESLMALDSWCADKGAVFISDEIYHGLTHAGGEASALSFSDRAIVINSFSKYFCMTGWRVGWMVLPGDLVRPVECLAQSLYISAPELSQIAAEAALEGVEEMDRVKAGYAKNRELLAARLPAMGLPLASPMDGAFYAWCDASRHTNDTMDFAGEMLQAIHVAATPGRDFDPVDGSRFMRFSYAGSFEEMETALDRMGYWLKGR